MENYIGIYLADSSMFMFLLAMCFVPYVNAAIPCYAQLDEYWATGELQKKNFTREMESELT